MVRMVLATVVACVLLCLSAARAEADVAGVIVHAPEASPVEVLAAREVRRYAYVRTGRLLTVVTDPDAEPTAGCRVVVGSRDREIVRQFAASDRRLEDVGRLRPEEYRLCTLRTSAGPVLVVAGGDAAGTLYGVYRLAEHLGVRFYLEGDVAPEEQTAFVVPELDERGVPLFGLRGIQPFHDFPEGPDFWSEDGYQAVIGQLPKLGLNFIGLHTYPEGGVGPEPVVWIGPPREVNADGTVRASYPSRHFCTLNGTWGYQPKETGAYRCGAAALFEHDAYTQDVQVGMCPWPETPERENELFNRMGDKLRSAFEHARALGVKTCVGTEVPLTVPRAVRERLLSGRPTTQPTAEDVGRLYEGMFTRIARAYPIDYYWFWTPENWTWEKVEEASVEAAIADIRQAAAAAEKVGAPFKLATCGWVLGPQYDRSLFDKVLPKSMAVSCISRMVGHEPVEPGFAAVSGREKWAIPWLEDDPAMIIPQLWVGRMRKDALDALQYGCTGLMGIHWRTRILGPNVSALAQAAWDQSAWGERQPIDEKGRFLPADDFWRDWAKVQFGEDAGEKIGALFERIDCRLPQPAEWVNGPGGIKPDKRPWSQVGGEYAFVDELASLRPLVKGAVSLERFDYWLDQLRYLRATGRVRCIWARIDEAMAQAEAEPDAAARRKLAEERVLPIRRELIEAVREIYGHLLATVSNTGEMGTIINWEQHLFPTLLEQPGRKLAAWLGGRLPEDAELPAEYGGQPRVFVPEVRTSVREGEALVLKAIVVDRRPAREVTVHWRPMGGGEYVAMPARHVARGVYAAVLPAEASGGEAFEYYVRALTAAGEALHYPAGAPLWTQTVVVKPGEQ